MRRTPGRVAARGAAWGAVVPCVVVAVLTALAIVAGDVPGGEAMSYAIVLAIVSVPACALLGAAIGALVGLARARRGRSAVQSAGDRRVTGAQDGGADAGEVPAPTALTADDVRAIPGVASVDVTRVEPGLEDLYVRFDADPDGERDVTVWHNVGAGSARVLVGAAAIVVDEADLRLLLVSVSQNRYRVEPGDRVVVWQASGDERVLV